MTRSSRIWFRGIATKLAALTAIAIAIGSPAAAATSTYQIVEGPDQLFKYAGGLIHVDMSASLFGTFDVTTTNDGTHIISRFDARLTNILSQGLYDSNWVDGSLLASELFVSPVGLTGEPVDGSLVFGPAGIVLSGPATRIVLTPTSTNLALLPIFSTPDYPIDSPSFYTVEPGFLVRLVPEPTTGALTVYACLIGALARSRASRLTL